MKKKKNRVLFVRTDEPFDKRLDKAADLTGRSVSDLAREAITEKLDRLSKRYPELQRPELRLAEAS